MGPWYRPGMLDWEIAEASRIARQAGAILMDVYGTDFDVAYKAAADPVTEADTKANAYIVGELKRAFPEDGIVAEETEDHSDALEDGRCWYVDPLDGTVNFVHGVPHVAVSVALYEGGQPLVGVVLDVFRREEFHAITGGGAWLDDRRLAVSPTKSLDEAIVATGFPYDRRDRANEYAHTLGAVLARIQGLRRMGTASLDLTWIAAGRYDAYWELNLGPWDVAAGLLLVREAGGVVTNRNGDTSTPLDDHFIASNALVHTEWRSLIDASLAGPRVDSAS